MKKILFILVLVTNLSSMQFKKLL